MKRIIIDLFYYVVIFMITMIGVRLSNVYSFDTWQFWLGIIIFTPVFNLGINSIIKWLHDET